MNEMDTAFDTFCALLEEVSHNLTSIVTEEDAKFQIINRMLSEVLGWPHSSVSCESKHDEGYSDYILKSGQKPTLLVEAKRTGKVDIQTSEVEKLKYLKISGPGLKNAQEGIEQAYSYAAPNGLPIAVLTDGLAWVVFKTFVPGEPYKSKQAIVFPSLECVRSEFALFYELLSNISFNNRTYAAVFDRVHQNRALLSRELRAAMPESELKAKLKSSLAFDLDPVFSTFFQKLTGDNDQDMLLDCFVETKESKIADFSLEKITANVLGYLDPKIKDLDGELASLIRSNVQDKVEGLEETGETIFIVGPTGSGKTTFLTRFFERTLSRSLRNQCVVIKINCLDASGLEDAALNWLTEEIIGSIETALYKNGNPTWEQLRTLYYGDYEKRRIGVDARLYEVDKPAFQRKFSEFLDRVVQEEREGYLKRLLSEVVKNRKKLPIIVIDNTDEFPPEFKQNFFQFTQALRRHVNHCLIVFPVTDKSAWSFSKTDIYSIYRSKSFFLPTPAPREVFKRRIEFINTKISEASADDSAGTYFMKKGIKVSIDKLNHFAKILETVFVDEDFASKTLGELSNYNIRRTLKLSQRVLTSPVFKIEELVAAYITGNAVPTNFAKFMKALMLGDYDFFKHSDDHEIFPVFNSVREVRHSPLLAVRILVLLNAARYGRSKSIEEKHVGMESIHEYFDALGCDEVALNSVLMELMEARLVEPYDMSNRTLSIDQRLAITPKGKVLLQLATRNRVFFTQLALTTPITDHNAAEEIRNTYRSKQHFIERVSQIGTRFSQYLIDEDAFCLSQTPDSEQFHAQKELIEDIGNFGTDSPSYDSAENLGENFKSGVVEDNIECIVDTYLNHRGFGFVDVPDYQERAWVHISLVKHLDVDALMSGDTILCEISRKTNGKLFVSQVRGFERDEDVSETVECQVIKIWKDRDYCFVSIEEGKRDAFLDLSLFNDDERDKVAFGTALKVEIIPDARGRGLQVKKIVSMLD